MNILTFLKEFEADGPTIFYAVESDRIQLMKLSDTLNEMGSPVGPIDAYERIELLSDKAVKYFSENVEEDSELVFEIGAVISTMENGADIPQLLKALPKSLKPDIDFKVYIREVRGFNYFDGIENKSMIILDQFEDGTHTEVTDENILTMLNNAISKKVFSHGSADRSYSIAGQIQVIENNSPLKWAKYEISFDVEHFYDDSDLNGFKFDDQF